MATGRLRHELLREDPFLEVVLRIEQHGYGEVGGLADGDLHDVAHLVGVSRGADGPLVRVQHAEPDLGDAERLIPYLRRSPYPTIQVVRRTALDRVRGGADEGTAYLDLSLVASLDMQKPVSPPLRERIAKANLATVKRVGKDTVEAAIRDILRDRDETEARLARDKGA